MVLAYKHINRWNRIKTPEINPHKYSQFICDMGTKNIQRGKGQSLKSDAQTIGYTYEKKQAWILTSYQVTKLELNVDLYLRNKT